ncbi:SRPBCC family protein [Salinimicrobium catena]|uniref:SRPBCC family protein n=1 Tax=Salinimicrobium catena TaxID=390640 RepID=UPI002FE4426D
MIYSLKRSQNLPISLDAAWEFFSDPGNLQNITPPDMGFEIIAGADRKMHPGQIIQYIVRPVAGIKTRWVTEITHVQEKKFFVDEQRFGPYDLWHHKHFFREIENGVQMEDVVDYKLPFGLLGRMVHPVLVKPRLQQIFDFRREKLHEVFGKYPGE